MPNPRKYRRFTPGRGMAYKTVVKALTRADMIRIDGETILEAGQTKVFDCDLSASLRSYEQRKNFNRLVGSGAIKVTRVPQGEKFTLDADGEVVLGEDGQPLSSSSSDGDQSSASSEEQAPVSSSSSDDSPDVVPGSTDSDFADEHLTSSSSSEEESDEEPVVGDQVDDVPSVSSADSAPGDQEEPEEEEAAGDEDGEDDADAGEESAPAVDPLLDQLDDDDEEEDQDDGELSTEERRLLLIDLPHVGETTADKLLELENPTHETIAAVPRVPKDDAGLHEEILRILTL